MKSNRPDVILKKYRSIFLSAVAVEMVKDRFTKNVTLEGRQTWVSEDGKIWDRTQTVYQTNVCLKAYTKKADKTDEQNR